MDTRTSEPLYLPFSREGHHELVTICHNAAQRVADCNGLADVLAAVRAYTYGALNVFAAVLAVAITLRFGLLLVILFKSVFDPLNAFFINPHTANLYLPFMGFAGGQAQDGYDNKNEQRYEFFHD